MGIKNLMKTLRPLREFKHISKFSGQTCAVDASCWLHRSTYSCAMELCTDEPTTKYLDLLCALIDVLLRNQVTPIVVFDGASLPMKEGELLVRQKRRMGYIEKARQFLASGDTFKADECFKRGVKVSPLMVRQFMEVLKMKKVQFVVAPYEADAQMTYLFHIKQVQFCITEDSDLFPFGCLKVFSHLDRFGNGFEISIEKDRVRKLITEYETQNVLQRSGGCGSSGSKNTTGKMAGKKRISLSNNDDNVDDDDDDDDDGDDFDNIVEVDSARTVAPGSFAPPLAALSKGQLDFLKTLVRFTTAQFLDTCILAGCDYLPNIPGLGLKRAASLMYKYGNVASLLEKIRYTKDYRRYKSVMPEHYEVAFQKARLTFLHQTVYCARKKEFVHLTPVPQSLPLPFFCFSSAVSSSPSSALPAEAAIPASSLSGGLSDDEIEDVDAADKVGALASASKSLSSLASSEDPIEGGTPGRESRGEGEDGKDAEGEAEGKAGEQDEEEKFELEKWTELEYGSVVSLDRYHFHTHKVHALDKDRRGVAPGPAGGGKKLTKAELEQSTSMDGQGQSSTVVVLYLVGNL